MFDFNKIKEAAGSYEKDMTAFLRAIVKNPGESCDETWKYTCRCPALRQRTI